jgi:hypothetical protein
MLAISACAQESVEHGRKYFMDSGCYSAAFLLEVPPRGAENQDSFMRHDAVRSRPSMARQA